MNGYVLSPWLGKTNEIPDNDGLIILFVALPSTTAGGDEWRMVGRHSSTHQHVVEEHPLLLELLIIRCCRPLALFDLLDLPDELLPLKEAYLVVSICVLALLFALLAFCEVGFEGDEASLCFLTDILGEVGLSQKKQKRSDGFHHTTAATVHLLTLASSLRVWRRAALILLAPTAPSADGFLTG